MTVKSLPIIWCFMVAGIAASGQDSTIPVKKLEINGYIKNLATLSFGKGFDSLAAGNLVHNRINLKWKPSGEFTAALEIRNRLFWGKDVENTPGFSEQLRNPNEWVNLSVLWFNTGSVALQTNVERLWMELRKKKWNVRLGRQRINWGMATIWNPNDIFNSYNFLDFDYEERPGADAIKAQYLLNDFSQVELAVSNTGGKNGTIAAARYSINHWGYDMQVLAGKYLDKFTGGLGWAGSLGNVGFKGEAQLFVDQKDSGNFNCTLEFSYVFKRGWYLNGSGLYNARGLSKPIDNWSKINFQFTPTSLMPAQWNLITSVSKEFTPRFSGNLSLVFSPQINLFIVYPSFKYNVAPNLDLDFVWQSYYLETEQEIQAVNHQIYLRLKWNF